MGRNSYVFFFSCAAHHKEREREKLFAWSWRLPHSGGLCPDLRSRGANRQKDKETYARICWINSSFIVSFFFLWLIQHMYARISFFVQGLTLPQNVRVNAWSSIHILWAVVLELTTISRYACRELLASNILIYKYKGLIKVFLISFSYWPIMNGQGMNGPRKGNALRAKRLCLAARPRLTAYAHKINRGYAQRTGSQWISSHRIFLFHLFIYWPDFFVLCL